MAANNILRCTKVASTLNTKYFCYNSQATYKFLIKKVPSLSCHQYITQNHFSTVLSSRQSNNRCYLYSLSNTLHSKSFLSTHINNDRYNVVINDPTAATSTELSSHIAQSLDSSSAAAASSAADASAATLTHATPITGELSEAVSHLAEPTLASLGLCNWTPVGLVQMFLEYLHIGWDMPWWAAIAASTVVARILLLPVLIKTQKNAVLMSNYMPQMQYLQAKFGEARKAGNTMEASKCANELMEFMKKHNLSPLKNAIFPLMQAPVFVSFFMGLRAMAKAPVESMSTGGIFWATDLTVPDPYYITPVIACSTLYIVLKIGAESGVRMENLKMAKYAMQALPIIAFPFLINFPAAVLYYWVTTNFCTLAIVSILKIKPLRKKLNLPNPVPLDPKFAMPKKGFISGIKESIEDQKVLAAIDDRRRTDEMRFLKAGIGPVPRTYSYDPTKPRPSNAAVSAKQRQS
ncbi:hypothetical protein JTE90_000795 [Oedothorax gibbosus]|uniref:Membrane insertase YidC/Oxa/ALB C-terminal domain-containing protein n=1 Tax=Oedothorax gibbosus TaxID=931172 RepID=A0AAV6U1X4_9ARAC|nr:hypothetical protein JTE90_000795 [Oedothorax gibbosus]